MSVPIAATLSLASALSLLSFGPAQSAPLTNLSAAAIGTEQTDAVQVRWRRGWHSGSGAGRPPYYPGSGAGRPPYYYGGTYLGYTYGGFPGFYGGPVFPSYRFGYGPYGWHSPY